MIHRQGSLGIAFVELYGWIDDDGSAQFHTNDFTIPHICERTWIDTKSMYAPYFFKMYAYTLLPK